MYAIIEWWSAFSQCNKLVVHPLATVDTYNTDIIGIYPDLASAMEELAKLKTERGA